MTTVLLIRHGLTALTESTLVGRTPGVPLDDRGIAQARAAGERIRSVPVEAIVSSPIERCRETAAIVASARQPIPEVTFDDRLAEVDYGDWTGRTFKELHREPLWKTVVAHPAEVIFPNGEPLRAMATRAVAAVRDWNDRLGPDATWVLVGHADPIRAILADALGLHFEGYQHLVVGPGSLSVVRYGGGPARVLRVNDRGGDPGDLLPAKKRRRS